MAKRIHLNRHYKPICIIESEGCVTEPEYFAKVARIFGNKVEISTHVSASKVTPMNVLERAKDSYKKSQNEREVKFVFVVVDYDQRSREIFEKLFEWARKNEKFHVIVSNPKFEYWLLLHFEDGSNIKGIRGLDDHIKKYIPKFDKHVKQVQFSKENIQEAINRAKSRCVKLGEYDFPENFGQTTVYRLVEKIIKLSE